MGITRDEVRRLAEAGAQLVEVLPRAEFDEEFAPPGPGGPLAARPGSAAAGRADLLTVLLHEMAHLAGRGDDAGPGSGGGLLDDVLDAGVRRTDALDQVFADL